MRHFTREKLQDLRDEAIKSADSADNQLWQSAYYALADAADRLDAMEARTIVKD